MLPLINYIFAQIYAARRRIIQKGFIICGYSLFHLGHFSIVLENARQGFGRANIGSSHCMVFCFFSDHRFCKPQ